jgi:hypothetical protein
MISPLTDEVRKSYADLPAHWLKSLWVIVQCIALARTTNLSVLKGYVGHVKGTRKARQTKAESHYRYLTRFFDVVVYHSGSHFVRMLSLIYRLTLVIIASLPDAASRIGRYLLLDGTEWRIRDTKVQFLTLCILICGVAIPIAVIDLQKIGHSSQKERVAFFTKLKKQFNFEGMILLADREYIGLQWFKSLRSVFKLHFVVRLKKGIYHDYVNGAPGKSREEMMEKLRRCKRKNHVSKRILIQGFPYYYIICRNPKADHPKEDEFVFFLTSLLNRTTAAAAYSFRWEIEVSFRHLKTNGFNLEDMRVEGPEKRELMFAILNLLFVICIREGEQFYRLNPQSKQMKTDHNADIVRVVHSTFRQGLAILLKVLPKLAKTCRYLRRFWKRKHQMEWAFV